LRGVWFYIQEVIVEKDGCGVGFLVSLKNESTHEILEQGIHALECMEHRGGVGPDNIGDGAGIMTSIPFELFNREPDTFAVAFLFIPQDLKKQKQSLQVFEETFWQYGLKVVEYREVPIDTSVISTHSLKIMPKIIQAIIIRPDHCRTLYSFERLLYHARQTTRSKEKENGIYEFFFSSLSPRNIIYKALCRSEDLSRFYLDLKNKSYKTNFSLFHRRFSTNTVSTWDKTQPFRLIAHNGEINTIEGNRAWAITREKDLGLKADELVTHEGVSDSGGLNEIAEGLRYRSSIPKLAETMAILIPPANTDSNYYKFWSRGMEPWDGPAMVSFSDGKYIGARLDRNGFRPCRWQRTDNHFYLSSEAGVFKVDPETILAKGALSSGESVTINVLSGSINFLDPKNFLENKNANFDPQTILLGYLPPRPVEEDILAKQKIFNFSKDEVDKIIIPMTIESKEPLSSMGDTACLPFLSHETRSIYDFFYQDFAQVTNPPIDYIREKIVTDMRVFLGRKPNIFEAKEFIPLKSCLELDGPVLSLGQMDYLHSLAENSTNQDIRSCKIDITFPKDCNLKGFLDRLSEIREEAIMALKKGFSLIILSDRLASKERLPIPSILAMTYLNIGLNNTGRRLRVSLIMEVGDVRNPHQMACLLSYGASAICPYMAIETALTSKEPKLNELFDEAREKQLLRAMKEGVLRVMSKRGISVFRSYQGSKLFTPVGLGQDVLDTFFKGKKSILGGYSLETLLELVKKSSHFEEGDLPNLFIYREQAAMKSGESHTLTSLRARAIHQLLNEESLEKSFDHFKSFSKELSEKPLLIRHLLAPKKISGPLKLDKVQPIEEILTTFGSGAMSFGAISAEAQRDLIIAFREIKGRSNSGEGGENPFYETEGIVASIKQIASGRFGVTAEYLVNGQEVQIKIAQGAKPGEGGQLMGVKVTEEIAKARFTSPGVDLISPAPQHDIYSIEDLKELIYEIKELYPKLKVSVKLVAGDNIGAISVGVAKTAADIIQISGGDGGTGAASILSMKHAGLPLEIGLLEVHRALVESGMRNRIILRADGGFITGKDIVVAAALGADEFDFGKLLLVGEGCIMARVCEKNTCPTGIATHAPRFKALYKGQSSKVVRLLQCLALEVRDILSEMGQTSLQDIIGKNHLLEANEKHLGIIQERGIKLDHFIHDYGPKAKEAKFNYEHLDGLNQTVIKEFETSKSFKISNYDRAIPATLAGLYTLNRIHKIQASLPQKASLKFIGSAGQGFAVFNVKEIDIRLEGEANDSVAKGMSGGKVVITPQKKHPGFESEKNTIIGNCALYGATGGSLFVHGNAGDRFAVRNSGASAVVDSVGLHACEYMSGGMIWILGETKGNIGAGMSGGVIYLRLSNLKDINFEYVKQVPIKEEDYQTLIGLGRDYLKETGSKTMKELLDGESIKSTFIKLIPKK
jgi:glutamate synthase domain-containing protein 2/glutamate synthase domain-containing protein 1/glutamate synthase domain-containing protein 3